MTWSRAFGRWLTRGIVKLISCVVTIRRPLRKRQSVLTSERGPSSAPLLTSGSCSMNATDPNERECVCCGHTGHYNGFKRANGEAPHPSYKADWICRSYWACVERGRARLARTQTLCRADKAA